MRLLKIVLVSALILMLGLFLSPSKDAEAADPCTISVVGNTATINCQGIKIGTVQLPTVKVTQTAPPLPAVTDIIRVPGPTRTITIGTGGIPLQTKTVTKTVTPNIPQKTEGPGVSTNKTGAGQTPSSHATIGPARPMSPNKPRIFDLWDGKTTVIEASLGVLATLVLIGLLLGMWYAGYTIGFREADSKNAKYIKDVLSDA